jgi:hypothetical protein
MFCVSLMVNQEKISRKYSRHVKEKGKETKAHHYRNRVDCEGRQQHGKARSNSRPVQW